MEHLTDYSELARVAFNNTSFSPERRGMGLLKEFDTNLSASLAHLRSLGIESATLGRFTDGYKKRLSAYLAAESRCASSMITGPSNFPVAKMQKRRNFAQAHYEELQRYENKVLTSLERAAKKRDKAERGITPLIEAQRNLNQRVQHQALMKKTNAALRKAKTRDEQELVLLELGYNPASIANLLSETSHRYKIGYQGWELSNNNAQIVRLRGRVEELKAKEYQAEKEEDGPKKIPFEGGYVEVNYTDDRVRILYDSKPDDEQRTKLKRHGMNWSPFYKAWQRKITPAAYHAILILTGIRY